MVQSDILLFYVWHFYIPNKIFLHSQQREMWNLIKVVFLPFVFPLEPEFDFLYLTNNIMCTFSLLFRIQWDTQIYVGIITTLNFCMNRQVMHFLVIARFPLKRICRIMLLRLFFAKDGKKIIAFISIKYRFRQ